ncbi:MAG: hypothetical protein ACRDZ3_12510 [Acidimicrobiia bacterium]
MDEHAYSEARIKGNESNRDRSRLERWLGVSRPEDEAAPSLVSQPPRRFSPDGERDGSRLERWLGVSSPEEHSGKDRPGGGDAARPAASRYARPFGQAARDAGTRTGPSKYAVPAVAVLTAGVLGLGVWTFDLRGQVSSLEKAVAAESSADADVARQLAETGADLERIDARLAEVEGLDQDLGAVETRLAELERRIGRRR